MTTKLTVPSLAASIFSPPKFLLTFCKSEDLTVDFGKNKRWLTVSIGWFFPSPEVLGRLNRKVFLLIHFQRYSAGDVV